MHSSSISDIRSTPRIRISTGRRSQAKKPSGTDSQREVSIKPILGLGFLVLALIGAAIVAKTAGIYLGIVVLGGFMIYHASRGDWVSAFNYYFAYAALEGLFKYGTNFSPIVYSARPAIAFICLVLWMMSGRKLERKPPYLAWFLVLSAIGFVQLFHPLGGGVASSLSTLILWYLFPLPFYLLGFYCLRRGKDLEKVLYACVVIGLIVAVIGLLQWVMGQGWTEAHFPGYSNLKQVNWFAEGASGERIVSWRPASTGVQPGAGSTWAHFGALSALGLMLVPGVSQFRKSMLVVAFFICYACMFASGVRLWVLAGLIEGLLMLFLATRNVQQAMRSVAILILACFTLWGAYVYANKISGGILDARYGETFSDPLGKFSEDRGSNFAFLPKFLSERPMGIGFQRGLSRGQYRSGLASANRETQFNAVAGDMGLPGLVALFCFIYGVTYLTFMLARRIKPPQERIFAFTLWTFLLGLNIGMLAGPMFQDHGSVFCFFAGGIIGLAQEMGVYGRRIRLSQRETRRAIIAPNSLR